MNGKKGTMTVAEIAKSAKEIAVSDAEPYDCAVERYNCTEDIMSWRTTWSVAKRRWCCVHDLVWCPDGGAANATSAVSLPKAQRREWSWSKKKRDWCCKHKNTGCPTQEHERALQRALEVVGVKVDQPQAQQQLINSTNTRRTWAAGSLLGLAAAGVALTLGLAGRGRVRAFTRRDIGLLPTGEEPEE